MRDRFLWLWLAAVGCGIPAETETEREEPMVSGGLEGEPHCGVTPSDGEVEALEALFEAPSGAPPGVPQLQLVQTGGVIPTYVHVVYGNDPAANLTQLQVDDQIAALNAAFATTGWSFDLLGTDWTYDPAWSTMAPGSLEESDAKAALRVGSADDLNVYTADLQGGLLGWATFPASYLASPLLDGTVIDYISVPGGFFPYDEGIVLVHEVGHWMGLFHTFQGGCGSKGDRVSDTAREAAPAAGCPVLDTCVNPGLDPVENYMDYTHDACKSVFTTGQDARMDTQFTRFRFGQ